MKQDLLNKIDELKIAIESEDVQLLLTLAEYIGVNYRTRSPILDFLHSLLVEDIRDYVNKKGKLKIERTSEYNIKTSDVYTIKDSVLTRNGFDVKWSSIGKLYQAYKKIHKI